MSQIWQFVAAHWVVISAIAATIATPAGLLLTALVRTAPEQRPKTLDDFYAWFRAALLLFFNMESARGKYPSLPATDSPAQHETK
ncbi:MAG TPA: hypothetical protein VKB47_08725 [Terracidiphilus sp.]|nr:hypothetical protein [Terracidiphilus sp.]